MKTALLNGLRYIVIIGAVAAALHALVLAPPYR
jgi:hypothetical protein